jgi:hypothetical protein
VTLLIGSSIAHGFEDPEMEFTIPTDSLVRRLAA